MPKRPMALDAGPWRGMLYSETLPADKEHVLYALDFVLHDDGHYWRRPSWDNAGVPTFGTTTTQGTFSFNLISGGLMVVVAGGEIWASDSSGVWTKRVTTANLTTAAITFDSAAPVYGCQFGNKFIFNDGINQPFAWDGTNGAGGLTKLTNAPTKCFGKPTVYYAKLFLIKDVAANGLDRNTMVWSEENQPNTGYEAGGFNNSWPLVQMGQGGLFALLGLNDGLYYFRRNSIGVVRGAVTTDFRAAGVHDDVSLEHGTTSPRGVAYYRGAIWFWDAAGHPFRYVVGAELEPLWPQLEWLVGDYSRVDAFMATSDVVAAFVCPCPSLECVTFWLRDGTSGNAGANRCFVFGVNGQLWSEWSLPGGTSTQVVGRYPEDAAVLPWGARPGIFVIAKDSTSSTSAWYACALPAQTANPRYQNGAIFPDILLAPRIAFLFGDRRGGPDWRFERFDVRLQFGSFSGDTTFNVQLWASSTRVFSPNPRTVGGSFQAVGAAQALDISNAVGANILSRKPSWVLQRRGTWTVVQVGEPTTGGKSVGWGIAAVTMRAYPEAISASMVNT